MIKVDKTVLNLNDVFTHMNVILTIAILTNFKKIKVDYQKTKEFLVNNTFEFGQHVEYVTKLGEQIKYLDINIKTLEEAMLAHESKAFEKRFLLKDLQVFGLN